jgi:hypothetical protein
MHTSTKLPQGKYQTRTEAEKRKKKKERFFRCKADKRNGAF